MEDAALQNLDADSYRDFIASQNGIIIFHKKLCPHCKVMKTVLEKIRMKSPEIALGAVDSEEFPDIMAAAGAERVPTLCAVKGGAVRARKVGLANPADTMAFYRNA